MVYFFSVEIMASSSQVRFEVLRGLVDAILSELSRREGVLPPPVEWVAESLRKPSLYALYIPKWIDGPCILIPAWFELPLRSSYSKFEPYIRFMIAHEFKHYLQELQGFSLFLTHRYLRCQYEGEADEYASKYSGITRSEYLRLGDEATEIIVRNIKSGTILMF
jgi:hypothetical protein